MSVCEHPKAAENHFLQDASKFIIAQAMFGNKKICTTAFKAAVHNVENEVADQG